MSCVDFDKKYIDDIYPEFSLKSTLKEYFDEYYPIDIHRYKNRENNKIIFDLYYNNADCYVKENLNNIKNLLGDIAKKLDLSIYSIKIYDTYKPRNKKGGATYRMMQEMLKYGKNCVKYKFIIKPDYMSQKHMN